MKSSYNVVLACSVLAAGSVALTNCTSDTIVDSIDQKNNDAGTLNDGGSTAIPSASELATSYYEALLAQVQRCQPGPDADSLKNYFRKDEVAAVIEAKGITDATKRALMACIASLGSAACGGTTTECFTLDNQKGSLATGAACLDSKQCATGVCTSNKTSCGSCVVALGSGVDCSGAKRDLCGPGLACVSTGVDTGVCATRTLVGDGSSCGNNAISCAAGTECSATGSGSYECRKNVAEGGLCRSTTLGEAQCDNGATYGCSPSSSNCVKLPALGETCGDGTAPVQCKTGLICERSNNKCRAPMTDIALNGICTYGDTCVAGASCNGFDAPSQTYRCIADLTEGSNCGGTTPGNCGAGLECDQTAKKCAKRLSPAACN